MRKGWLLGMIGLLLLSFTLKAVEEDYVFDSTEQQQQFNMLLKELRCVTCPNQNIADSQAPVAKAMQEEIYHRLIAGETPNQVKEFLLSRYGDYVLYRPVMKSSTWLLWLGPLGMLFIGLGIWLKVFYLQRQR